MSACKTREVGAVGLLPMTKTLDDKAAAPLLDADGNRRSALIVNADAANSAYFITGRGSQVGDQSYEIKPGEGVAVKTQGQVWMRAATGLSVVVKVLVETGEGS